LSAAQQQAINWIQKGSAKELGALGTEIGRMLAEMVAETADAKSERDHWKETANTVLDEIKVLVAVCIRKQGGSRLTITKQEYFEIVKDNMEVYASQPDGMRMYELRERRRQPKSNKVGEAVGRIIRPH
ncbi:MAG TPA: hypothetical protein VET26_09530, partial [Candidatus Sulfotelmatobacter sp.]|nr:hypothetical protein [Candidatus Sulfotelmatobacter sp.]